MKRRKIVLALLLSLTMLVVPCASAVSITNDDSQKLTAEEIAVIEAQTPALDLVARIKQNFEEKDYGGMCIDENNKLNVFLLSNPKAEKIVALAQAANDSSNKVIFKHADYSLQTLNDEIDRVYNYLVENGMYCSLSLDESINKINITLSDPDILHEIATDPNMFNITDEDKDLIRVKCSSAINCGSTASTASQSFSVAFMAKDTSGNIGFITAGHCISEKEAMYQGKIGVFGTKMGTCSKSVNNNLCDAAFVKRSNTNFVPGNTGEYSNVTIHGVNSDYIVQGETCYVEGSATGRSTGTILSTNFSNSSINVNNFLKFSNKSEIGDSGGCIWVGRAISSTILGRYIIGVQSSKIIKKSTGTFLYSIGTRADVLYSKLGISSYYSG